MVIPDGSLVRHLRIVQSLTQKQLAKKVRCSKRTIERIEHSTPVSAGLVGRVAAAFGITQDELIHELVMKLTNTISETDEDLIKWQEELKKFKELKPILLKDSKLRNKFVAIHEGKVVDTHENKFYLARRVSREFPDKVVLIAQVSLEPRIVDFPSSLERSSLHENETIENCTIEFDKNRGVIWVNSENGCVLRICNIPLPFRPGIQDFRYGTQLIENKNISDISQYCQLQSDLSPEKLSTVMYELREYINTTETTDKLVQSIKDNSVSPTSRWLFLESLTEINDQRVVQLAVDGLIETNDAYNEFSIGCLRALRLANHLDCSYDTNKIRQVILIIINKFEHFIGNPNNFNARLLREAVLALNEFAITEDVPLLTKLLKKDTKNVCISQTLAVLTRLVSSNMVIQYDDFKHLLIACKNLPYAHSEVSKLDFFSISSQIIELLCSRLENQMTIRNTLSEVTSN